jgi:hypothetical protein
MSQAAFVRSLVNSFFRRTAGLFSDKLNDNYKIINWNRAQQAGFVILLWQKIEASIKNSDLPWIKSIRNSDRQTGISENSNNTDLAFAGKTSFLSRDQGVRGVMTFSNDFFYAAAKYGEIDFNSFVWNGELDEQTIANENIADAITLFKSNRNFIRLINEVSKVISSVDWRTSSASFANDQEREYQMRYKGSSGYTEFYKEIQKFAKKSTDANVIKYANQLS